MGETYCFAKWIPRAGERRIGICQRPENHKGRCRDQRGELHDANSSYFEGYHGVDE